MIKFTLTLFFLLNINLLAGCSDTSDVKNQNINKENSKLNTSTVKTKNISDLSVMDMDRKEVKLSDYKGKVLMIVNVASKCGYTKQYKGLEEIYKKYKDRGFEILAFPCNDFGGQEPGSNDEIRTFCESKYNVTFPLFDKIAVLGENKSPLYQRLTENSDPAGDIGWNFEKFIIDKNGDTAARFKSKVEPESEEIVSVIEEKISL
ncbi:MAG TPA: glutathione peroxidase [Bacteroidetes bacterium]|nr:glutathione peroxidase [Bacteroidota bacterium]